MNREQLAHVLRAAASIAGDGDIVVLGSQSILGAFSDSKDFGFVAALIRAQLIDPAKLYDLADSISARTPIVHATRERIQVCVTRAGRTPPTG